MEKNSSKYRNVAEMDYEILCKHFGEMKAREIMLLTKALNEEARIRIGAQDITDTRVGTS